MGYHSWSISPFKPRAHIEECNSSSHFLFLQQVASYDCKIPLSNTNTNRTLDTAPPLHLRFLEKAADSYGQTMPLSNKNTNTVLGIEPRQTFNCCTKLHVIPNFQIASCLLIGCSFSSKTKVWSGCPSVFPTYIVSQTPSDQITLVDCDPPQLPYDQTMLQKPFDYITFASALQSSHSTTQPSSIAL